MSCAVKKAPSCDSALEMVNACSPPDIETLCHTSRQGVQAAAIGPFWLHVLEGIALLNMSLLIKDPDGFSDINKIGGAEAFGDQCGAHCAPALDVLFAMVIVESLLLPGRCSSTNFLTSLKHRYGIPRVMQYMFGGKSTASSTDNRY